MSGGEIFLGLAALASLGGSSGGPPPPPPPPPGELIYSEIFHGVETGTNGGPDAYLFPGPPSGRVYFLESVLQSAEIPIAKDFHQGFFGYSKVLNPGFKEATTPNVFTVCDNGSVIPGKTGNFYAWGSAPGVDPPPLSPIDDFSWTIPLPMTSSLRVQVGSGLGIGNQVKTILTFGAKSLPATEYRFTNSLTSKTGFTARGPPVPEGKRLLLETAFIKGDIQFGATLARASGGLAIARHIASDPAGQSTGGYGLHQHALKTSSTPTIWPMSQYIEAGDSPSIDVIHDTEGTVAYMLLGALIAT